MKMQICWPWELFYVRDHTVVVIDAYAATTNIIVLMAHKIAKLYIVNHQSLPLVKKAYPQALVVGESLKFLPDFFDASNAPYQVHQLDVSDRMVLFMTINGTQVMEAAFKKGAKKVYIASFLNLISITKWLKAKHLEKLMILTAGDSSEKNVATVEDIVCAESLESLLQDKQYDLDAGIKRTQQFIQSYYSSPNFPASFQVMFERFDYPIVPQCHWEKEGLISITNAYDEKDLF